MENAHPLSASRAGPEREAWLIVDRQAGGSAAIDELLEEIQRGFGLDPYSARLRLCGRGYSLLLRGTRDRLAPLLSSLAEASIPARVLEPVLPKGHPAKLQGLRHNGEHLSLMTAQGEVKVAGDLHVIALLADLSGEVIASGVKQMLVRNAYQGAAATVQHVDEEDLCLEISRARPVLDLYLLDRQGEFQGAVRVLPGTYDPTGLGDQRTPSAGRNLLALIALVRKSAGLLTLRSDFGLANVPGCQLETPLNDGNLEKNLAALSRYGALAVEFTRQCGAERPRHKEEKREVVDRPPSAISISTLLPPPDNEERSALRGWWQREDALGIVFASLLLAVAGMGRWDLLPWLWRNGFETGLIPALSALLFFWRSFAAVRLKRMIENTPASRIRSLASGMVEVSGRVERCYALVTPVTQMPCIYYRLSRYHRTKRNRRWEMTAQQSSGLHPFWLSDGTGRVRIDPAGSMITPSSRQEGAGAGLGSTFMGREATPEMDEKWVEESIPEGAQVYVFGFSAPRRNLGTSLHEATAERLRKLKGSSELRQRFDRDGDGEISVEEWDEARQAIADDVARERLASREGRKRQEEALVISAPPGQNFPFIIAQTINEAGVTRALWWRALGFSMAGLLLAVWALYRVFNIVQVSGN